MPDDTAPTKKPSVPKYLCSHCGEPLTVEELRSELLTFQQDDDGRFRLRYFVTPESEYQCQEGLRPLAAEDLNRFLSHRSP